MTDKRPSPLDMDADEDLTAMDARFERAHEAMSRSEVPPEGHPGDLG